MREISEIEGNPLDEGNRLDGRRSPDGKVLPDGKVAEEWMILIPGLIPIFVFKFFQYKFAKRV
jgi:hypothetical protein